MKTDALPLCPEDLPKFDALSACVHCGLCLEVCPTYKELRVEMDSPRGRLYLMRGLAEARLPATPRVVQHLDQCLDCRACETACPSGVQYAHILETTRDALEPGRHRSVGARLLRWWFFERVLRSRAWQRSVFRLAWVAQVLGFTALGRVLGRHRLLPRRLAAAAAQAPRLPLRSFRETHGAGTHRAQGVRRKRVAFFTGCIADHLQAQINAATLFVLTRNGCEVEVLPNETCCGALHLHNGARASAKDLAASNVRAFTAAAQAEPFDAIITNAAGCGAELRAYGHLLPDQPEAAAFADRVRDVSSFLHELGIQPPPAAATAPIKVAYDEPCHLLHAQKISAAPRALLDSIPGVLRVPLEDAESCCGSAGLYSVTQPELSARVTARKVDNIRRSGASVIATANPGCLMQIAAATRAAGVDVQVKHPVELLAEAYGWRGG